MTTAATDTALTLHSGDCLDVLSRMEPASVDLVFTSPPYERARKYGELNFSLRGFAWAAWCADRFEACLRVSRGLVAWVVGHGSGGADAPWSAAPALLVAELHSRGVHLLRPCWYRRHGIPGAGGNQWFSPKIDRRSSDEQTHKSPTHHTGRVRGLRRSIRRGPREVCRRMPRRSRRRQPEAL